MIDVEIRVYAPLNDFLPPQRRQVSFGRRIRVPTSVKDLLEGVGIPHPEIAAVLIDEAPVGFDALVDRPCRVAAYPSFFHLDVPELPELRPPEPDPPQFVLDVHLGRLARYLRLLGFDTRYDRSADDDGLVQVSRGEGRILLTRDREMLMRAAVDHGHFIRSDDPWRQILDVARRYDLAGWIDPFTRCLKCNDLIYPIDKAEIEHRLEPGTRRHFDRFWECRSCGNLYWRGSHYQRLRGLVAEIDRSAGGA